MVDSAAVEMRCITKRFPGVLANERVDLEVRTGEIHALLGENGAGKTTLMSILCGLYKPDDGEIYIKGRKVSFNSPRAALNAGIGMVHQHFRLVSLFTVAENIVLGLNKGSSILKMDRVEKEVEELSRRYNLVVDPGARVWQLSLGEQQRVEIIKTLFLGTDTIILDEPTAVLTPQESGELFKTLLRIARDGKAVILITHKLNEVMSIADRITVLRNGRSVATVEKKKTTVDELAMIMVGQVMQNTRKEERILPGEVVLDLQQVNAFNDKMYPALRDVALTVRAGEIVGVAGVAGNGQRELAEVIAGLRPVRSGSVLIDGKNMTNCSVREIINNGVAFVPEDRLGMGLVPNLTILDNIILRNYRDRALLKGPFLDRQAIRSRAELLVKEFSIKTPGLNRPVKTMSGGHLQRLLLAREVHALPKLIVVAYPTRGLDVRAVDFIHQVLLAQRNRGVAILMISEDLDEIFNLADRIAVLYEGRVMDTVPTGEADVQRIGLLMAGVSQEGRQNPCEN